MCCCISQGCPEFWRTGSYTPLFSTWSTLQLSPPPLFSQQLPGEVGVVVRVLRELWLVPGHPAGFMWGIKPSFLDYSLLLSTTIPHWLHYTGAFSTQRWFFNHQSFYLNFPKTSVPALEWLWWWGNERAIQAPSISVTAEHAKFIVKSLCRFSSKLQTGPPVMLPGVCAQVPATSVLPPTDVSPQPALKHVLPGGDEAGLGQQIISFAADGYRNDYEFLSAASDWRSFYLLSPSQLANLCSWRENKPYSCLTNRWEKLFKVQKNLSWGRWLRI